VKRRSLRAFAAFFAVFAVLFAQLAVSAYACPGEDGMRAVMAMDEAPPCEQHPSPEARTPLCLAHCQQADQSLDHRTVPMPALALVALPSSWLAPRAILPASAPPGDQPSLLVRPTGPPIAVRHCCFRI
jgi:hypothetical protein